MFQDPFGDGGEGEEEKKIGFIPSLFPFNQMDSHSSISGRVKQSKVNAGGSEEERGGTKKKKKEEEEKNHFPARQSRMIIIIKVSISTPSYLLGPKTVVKTIPNFECLQYSNWRKRNPKENLAEFGDFPRILYVVQKQTH